MTACMARLTVITVALLGVATAAHAQVIIANDFDAPNGFITILTAPAVSQAPPFGNCAILFPAPTWSMTNWILTFL